MKFSTKDFFSKCDQILRKLRIFCAVMIILNMNLIMRLGLGLIIFTWLTGGNFVLNLF